MNVFLKYNLFYLVSEYTSHLIMILVWMVMFFTF